MGTAAEGEDFRDAAIAISCTGSSENLDTLNAAGFEIVNGALLLLSDRYNNQVNIHAVSSAISPKPRNSTVYWKSRS